MRQKIDLPDLYTKALGALPETIDGEPPEPLPDAAPMALDELLGGAP